MSKTTDPPDLAAAVLAAIADEEVEARRIGSLRRIDMGPGEPVGFYAPARVLARCAADRAIVALHPEMLYWCQGCGHESYPCRTLVALAQGYGVGGA